MLTMTEDQQNIHNADEHLKKEHLAEADWPQCSEDTLGALDTYADDCAECARHFELCMEMR